MEFIAENIFREKFLKENPNFEITKKGYPDFMIIDKLKNEIVEFVEVKRNKKDLLTKEQKLFKKFCLKHNLPFRVWYFKTISVSLLKQFRNKLIREIWERNKSQWEMKDLAYLFKMSIKNLYKITGEK